MKKYIQEEFVRIDDNFKNGMLDFYGEYSPINLGEQKEFLKRYSNFYKNKYGKDFAYKKAVAEEDAINVTKSLSIDKSDDVFVAYKKEKLSQFNGWQLYTDRASIINNEVHLHDNHTFPVPCAKYEYDFAISKIDFSVKISKNYYKRLLEGVGPTTTGRFVEFRKGCLDCVKLLFAPNGELYYKDGSKKPYHYNYFNLGNYAFDEWNNIEISFFSDKLLITFNGEITELNYSNKVCADNVFLSGGMQPIDDWSFRVNSCTDVNDVKRNLFIKEIKIDTKEELIGDVTLPYVLGTEANKDNYLILRKKFNVVQTKNVYVHVDCLDPSGDLYVNGKLAFHIDTFDAFDVDVTKYVNVGENLLELVIYPRAPEVLYAWHRHKDYYNGWFCLGVEIKQGLGNITQPIIVQTKSIEKAKINFNVAFDVGEIKNLIDNDSKYYIFMQKVFPKKGKQIKICSDKLTSNLINKEFLLDVDEWNVNSPSIYKFSIQIVNRNRIICENTTETGFRIIEQKNGCVYLNGERILLKGALNMQFLPPYNEIPLNHVCPKSWQIVQQVLSIKELNGNIFRMHQLGYGTNDLRFTKIMDRLGVLSIWTTRYIDSIESMTWSRVWYQKDFFVNQIKRVINSPSIIMWEGSNELHTDTQCIDRVYDEFVSAVKEVDKSRLICPVSHLYYGGGIYECGCKYYNNDGTQDESGNLVNSSFGWRDKDVVRSAHTYCLLLGYGESWRNMATQNWKFQKELFEDKNKSYIVSEYAIIGRQNPNTDEAKQFINKDSYELPDELSALGHIFSDDEWELSQAFQSLCASVSTRQLYRFNADGMIWCCLTGGANNGSYLKPILDFYGYKKQVFYSLNELFQDIVIFSKEPNVLLCKNYVLEPMVYGLKENSNYYLKVEILNENGNVVFEKPLSYSINNKVESIKLPNLQNGYYVIRYTVEEYIG